MKVINFRGVKTGTIVKRSAHWISTHGGRPGQELGIIVDRDFFDDAKAGVICYPVIHWEGEVMASLTHPANAEFFRDVASIEYIEVA